MIAYAKNLYIYQANHKAGMRVLKVDNYSSASLTEIGFFDMNHENNAPLYPGGWTAYPYFDSETIIVRGIESGLFVLWSNLMGTPPPTDQFNSGCSNLSGTPVTFLWLALFGVMH
jgi:hypothetical protein